MQVDVYSLKKVLKTNMKGRLFRLLSPLSTPNSIFSVHWRGASPKSEDPFIDHGFVDQLGSARFPSSLFEWASNRDKSTMRPASYAKLHSTIGSDPTLRTNSRVRSEVGSPSRKAQREWIPMESERLAEYETKSPAPNSSTRLDAGLGFLPKRGASHTNGEATAQNK